MAFYTQTQHIRTNTLTDWLHQFYNMCMESSMLMSSSSAVAWMLLAAYARFSMCTFFISFAAYFLWKINWNLALRVLLGCTAHHHGMFIMRFWVLSAPTTLLSVHNRHIWWTDYRIKHEQKKIWFNIIKIHFSTLSGNKKSRRNVKNWMLLLLFGMRMHSNINVLYIYTVHCTMYIWRYTVQYNIWYRV